MRRFIRHFTFLLLAAGLIGGCGYQVSPQDRQEAFDIANEWLRTIDHGSYISSWYASSDYLKDVMGKEDWQQYLLSYRAPCGIALSRKLKRMEYRYAIPGMPQGDYIELEFDGRFEKKGEVGERVFVMKEEDGQWRTCGYRIDRPDLPAPGPIFQFN